MDVLDGGVVIISVGEIVMESVGVGGGGGSAFAALRALRLLRVMKMFGRIKSLQILSTVVVDTVSNLSNMAAITLLFLVQVAILGLQIFGGKYSDELAAQMPLRYVAGRSLALSSVWRPWLHRCAADQGVASQRARGAQVVGVRSVLCRPTA